MRKNIKYIFAIALGVMFYSCSDVFEEDISDDIITIIKPQDGDVIEGNTIQFLWNTINGADNYNIQVYNSNFLLIDSTVTSPPFHFTLNTGIYEWRIKGENFAYQTQYTIPASFEMITSEDLTNQLVVLNSPTDNVYTNNPSIIFTWSALESATNYTFELVKVTTTGNITIFLQEEILTTSITIDNTIISEDAEYIWKVKAVNESSETTFSSRTSFIDTVAPSTPTLLTPEFEEEFVVGEEVLFSWNFGEDGGVINSPISSVYDISSDDGFVTIIESGNLTITNFNFIFNNSGTYYWRVRGEDEAGNIGAYNLNGKLIINE